MQKYPSPPMKWWLSLEPSKSFCGRKGKNCTLYWHKQRGRKSKDKTHGGGSASRPALPRTEEKDWDYYRCPDGGGRSFHGVAQRRARLPHPSPLWSRVLSPGFEPSVLDPHSKNLIFQLAIKLETSNKRDKV